MEQIQHYVLFPNHDNGMRLYRELKKSGIRSVISPTPREASKCCGISLIIQEEDIRVVQDCVRENDIEILKIVAIERNVDNKRDRYC